MSSFHNTPPRTREERLAAANRDSVEKGNLKSRTGGHHKYQEPGNPIIPEPSSPLYAAESNRFQRGVADEIREQKQQETRKHQVKSTFIAPMKNASRRAAVAATSCHTMSIHRQLAIQSRFSGTWVIEITPVMACTRDCS